MPGLFGILHENPAEHEFLKKSFHGMAGHLNFDGYELDIICGKNFFLGNIAPKLSVPSMVIKTKKGPARCMLAGHIFSINGTDFDYDYESLFKYIISSIESNNDNALAFINGHYTIALLFESNNELQIISDRFAFFKHFYSVYQDKFLFFPDFAALDALKFLPRKLDYECFIKFLNFGFPDDDSTLLEDVKVLPNASLLTFHNGQLSIKKYWDWEMPNLLPSNTLENCADQCYSLMQKTLMRSLNSQSKDVCISLSGGLDSRFICHAATKSSLRAATLSYGYSKSHEAKIAAQVADILNTDHYHEEPDEDYVLKSTKLALSRADGMLFPYQFMQNGPISNLLMRLYPKKPVHFSGFYIGGLLDAYYWTPLMLERSNDFLFLHLSCKKKLPTCLSLDNITKIFPEEVRQKAKNSAKNFGLYIFKKELDKVKEIGIANFIDRFFILTHGRRYLSSTLFFHFFTRDVLPFFDYDLFDFYLTIPPEFRLNDQLRHKILQQNMKELALIPYNKTGQPVPKPATRLFNIMKKLRHEYVYYTGRITKGRFIPSNPYNYVQSAKWMRCIHGAPFVRELLTDKRTIERGLFNLRGINELFSDLNQGKWTGTTISKLFYIELWLRKFIDCSS